MKALFYAGLAMVLIAIGIVALEIGLPMDVIHFLDWLFWRAAAILLLWLLWRLVKAQEGR